MRSAHFCGKCDRMFDTAAGCASHEAKCRCKTCGATSGLSSFSGLCIGCSLKAQRKREQSVVGKAIKSADFSSSHVRIILDDGTEFWASDSGPMDGRGEYSFHWSLTLPGDKP